MKSETYEDEQSWLAGREGSIGSSALPGLLGLTDKGWLFWWMRLNPEARRKYAKQIEEEDSKPFPLNAVLRRSLEPQIEGFLEEQQGIKIYDPGDFFIMRNGGEPRTHASPDGLLVDAEGNVIAHTEYKTCTPYQAHKWKDGPDLYALVQLHHLLAFEDCDWDGGYIAALIGYGDSEEERLSFEVEGDQDLIEVIQEVLSKFFRYVDTDTMPPMDGLSSTTEALRLMYPARRSSEKAVITLTDYATEATERMFSLIEQKKEIEKEIDREKQIVEQEVGRAGVDQGQLPTGEKWSRTVVEATETKCPGCGEVVSRRKEHTKFVAPRRSS
jgi:predicted phage-related endonuclease